MTKQEDFHRLKNALKMQGIDNEARILKEAEIRRNFNRNQKRITP